MLLSFFPLIFACSNNAQKTDHKAVSIVRPSQVETSSEEALETITFIYHFKEITEEKLRSDVPKSVAFATINGEVIPVKRIELFKNGSTRTTKFYDSSGKLLKTDIAHVDK